MSVPLEGLEYCEKYVAGVTLSNQTADAIPEGNLVRFTTKYDVRAAPQHIHFALNDITRSMNITWQHSCHLVGNHPDAYFIHITDIALKNSTIVRVNATEEIFQLYRFSHIPRGARYNVSISSANQSANSIAVYQVHAFHLPSPPRLMVQHVLGDKYLISWPPVRYNETE